MRRVPSVVTALLTLLMAGLTGSCGDVPTELGAPQGPTAVKPGVSFVIGQAPTGEMIATDKDDYAPGDTVWFTGAGWQAGDTLDILLVDEPLTHAPHEWWVPVNETGEFRDSTYVVDVGDLGVTFTLTATSRATGQSLTVVFTDGTLGPVSLDPTSRSVAETGSVDYTVNVDMTGNGNPCTVTLSVLSSPALPSGAVATITGGNPISATNLDFSRTLHIQTTAVVPGSYPFKVQAAPGSGCGGSTRTADGTLIVFGAATHLAFGEQPSNTAAAASITPDVSVRVLDANNNVVANSSASINMDIGTNPSSGTLSGTLTRSAVNGVATFPGLNIDNAGDDYTLRASSSGLSDATSDPFDIAVGPAAQVVFITQPSGASPNTAFGTQPVVEVQDAAGNRVTTGVGSGTDITLAIVSGTGTAGAVLTCTSNPLGATSGRSTFAGCKINLAGTGYKLRASTGSLGGGIGVLTVDSDPFDVTPSNPAPTVDAGDPYTVAEGTQLTLSPTVNDPDAGDVLTYKWTIAYTTPMDAGGSCTFVDNTVKNAKLTCDDDSNGGTFTLTLEVKDGVGGHTVTDDATLTVNNANPTADAGGPYSGNEGSAIALNGSGSDAGANDVITAYHWTVDAAGIDAGGTCTLSNANIASPTVTCTDDGAFKVTLTVTDDDGATSTADEATLTVANVAPTITSLTLPLAPVPVNTSVSLSATFSDPGSNDAITAYHWTVDVTGIDAGGACTFSDADIANPTVTCTDDGAFKVALTVTDDDGATSTADEATLTVANVAPTITSLTLPLAPVPVNTSVSLSATFSDPGSNDTHTASINWEAGTNSGTVTESPGSVSGSYTYTAPGIYTVILTVLDDDGESDTETFMYVVVYDPSAGFVTGGGWINSLPGMYLPDPSLSGKANFGFVSKYQKGATVPTGNTEFQFHAASLNFSSTSYEWLVVNGTSKATYKGSGKINGGGNYGFLLSVIDNGNAGDTFRMKIWDRNTNTTVYDNQNGAGDNVEATTPIAGGNIVVHTGKK